MRKVRMAGMAITLCGTVLAGIPAASAATPAASGYSLDHTNKAVAGSCTVWQDVVHNLGQDGIEYQHGHASAANGHLCGYIQEYLREGGVWTVNFAPPLWRSGSSGWSPLTYDDAGGWVKGCVTDYTTASAEACTIKD